MPTKSAFIAPLALHSDSSNPKTSASERPPCRACARPRHLLADKSDRRRRQHGSEGIQLSRDIRHIGDEAVERHERGDGGKDRQQHAEGHPTGDEGDVVGVERLERAAQDLTPAARRDIRRAPRALAWMTRIHRPGDPSPAGAEHVGETAGHGGDQHEFDKAVDRSGARPVRILELGHSLSASQRLQPRHMRGVPYRRGNPRAVRERR